MRRLQESVRQQDTDNQKILEVAMALLVSCFYFELDSVPIFDNGMYLCKGKILCRDDSLVICQVLTRLFGGPFYLMLGTDSVEPLDLQRSICHSCHRFSRKVALRVRHPTEKITIFIKINDTMRRKISGFPQSMAWFVQQQQLSMDFGRKDHVDCSVIPRGGCLACEPLTPVCGLIVKRKKMNQSKRADPPKRLKLA